MKTNRPVTVRQEQQHERALCTAILALRSVEECRSFFRDLCTPAELQAMIDQWRQSRWVGAQVFAWTYAGSKLADQGDLLAVFHHFNVTGT